MDLAPHLRLDPFPHCVLRLDQRFYDHCEKLWVPSSGAQAERTNVPIDDDSVREPLAAQAFAAMALFAPNLLRAYPGWSPGAMQVRVLWSAQKASDQAFVARNWHLDHGRKVVIGLWYFREPGNDAGGDLLLRSTPDETPRRIPYARNRLVLFPNLPWAWHAVSERGPSQMDRRFINILLGQDEPLHDYCRDAQRRDVVRPVRNHFRHDSNR
ncbi:MAG: 2OG-Fe(II) oxygenase [Pseudomonadota bacterium]